MSRVILNCGYVPLIDSAPLIIAKELGFAEHEGLVLNLLRQPSWAALRDLLALGHLDAAHMLAPLPIAMSLGLSGAQVDVAAPLVLSANGTVFGVSTALADRLRNGGWQPDHLHPKAFIDCLAALGAPLRVGVPFPYSMHRLLFEYLIRDTTDDFRKTVSIVTTPPPLMANAVADGEIDLFAVGEPWGTVAVASGAAELVLPGSSIWAHAPEKVIGARLDWIDRNQEQAGALIRALFKACQWLHDTRNSTLASEILARSEHLDLPDDAIDPALTGRILPSNHTVPWDIPNFVKFGGAATNFPWRSAGAWIGAQLRDQEGLHRSDIVRRSADCMRPDLFRTHLKGTNADMPGASSKVEGSLLHPTAVASTRGEMILEPDAFFDGKTYEFAEIE